ncbi:MAG: hypothetical protein L6R42_000306 [Xanthoria sp. 1 TBL-2021]|nr:MAG: hypothetical protein L6R42_000306 [Xanthoria sp. 1 TBL-2021]
MALIAPRERPQRSMQVMMKQDPGANLPMDLGLLEGTFIMPTGRRKPSIFSEPRRRWQLELHRARQRFIELRMGWSYKYLSKRKPRPKMGLRPVGPTAQALYTQMYTAFADGDITTLSNICTEGLLASFKSRIASRPRNERLRWTLHKFIRGPKFVSHRIAILPYKGSAIRQLVVRMRTRQSLARMVSGGPGRPDALVQGTGEEKEVSEYLVLQRRMWKEIEEPWMVWGTTEETDPDTVLSSSIPARVTEKSSLE